MADPFLRVKPAVIADRALIARKPRPRRGMVRCAGSMPVRADSVRRRFGHGKP